MQDSFNNYNIANGTIVAYAQQLSEKCPLPFFQFLLVLLFCINTNKYLSVFAKFTHKNIILSFESIHSSRKALDFPKGSVSFDISLSFC